MDGGLIIVGWVLSTLLCRLEGLRPVDCKPLHPVSLATRHDCEQKLENIKHSFPNMEPEQFGMPKGTRLHITMRCRPLYGDHTA